MQHSDIVAAIVENALEDSQEMGTEPFDELQKMLEQVGESSEKLLERITDPAGGSSDSDLYL